MHTEKNQSNERERERGGGGCKTNLKRINSLKQACNLKCFELLETNLSNSLSGFILHRKMFFVMPLYATPLLNYVFHVARASSV